MRFNAQRGRWSTRRIGYGYYAHIYVSYKYDRSDNVVSAINVKSMQLRKYHNNPDRCANASVRGTSTNILFMYMHIYTTMHDGGDVKRVHYLLHVHKNERIEYDLNTSVEVNRCSDSQRGHFFCELLMDINAMTQCN